MLQEPPALRLLPQVLAAIAKAEALVPPIVIDVIGRDAVPALANVKVCDALVDPTVTLPKDALEGVSAAWGAAAAVPAPVNVALWVPTLSTTARVADALPAAAGVKVTPMLQEPPALRLLPQVLAAIVKAEALVPPIAMEVIGRDAVPALANVKVCDVLVDPTVTLPKDALVGVSAAWGAVALAPVPLNEAVWGEPAASSATVTAALKLPAAVGAKVTEMVQLDPAASVVPQLLVC
jgi:hypothetical protein